MALRTEAGQGPGEEAQVSTGTAIDASATAAKPVQNRTTDADLLIGRVLSHYRLEEPLGAGGMGVLYRATDLKLGRSVAVKLLARHLVSDETAKARFVREACAASALDHPNIANVHEIGEEEGELFIVMALYEGETLQQRLAKGRLAVDEAVAILRQVALGLEAAHRAGIVHRDIKPANILLTSSGTVKILDFGLAKLVSDSEAQAMTKAGQAMGTVLYMSPEQLRGEKVDARSDLWSIGVLAYELLAGVSPFQADSSAATAMRILNDEPPSLATVLGVPDWLAELVSQLLRKNLAERPQTASEVLKHLEHGKGGRPPAAAASKVRGVSNWFSELKRRRVFRALVGYGIAAFAVLQIIEPVMHGLHWPETVLSYVVAALAAGFPIVITLAWIFDVKAGHIERTAPASVTGPRGVRLALLLLGIGVLAAAPGLVWYFGIRGRAASVVSSSSIAVLPFVNLSGDKENEYFSDGMTEEIIDALANVEGVRVVARTSAFSFKGKNLNVRQIGEELNVATVLEGSVQREGNQLRVVAKLIGVADGYHLWSKTYDRELKNVFSVEDDLARAIVQALRPRLVQGRALVRPATESTEAHDLYLKGRFFWNQRTKEGLAKATALFEQALALDPGYALAHSGLADCYSLSVQYGGARAAPVFPKAKAHALKAVELDDGLAEAHASLGEVKHFDEHDWIAAEREYKRAIELRPGYATAHHWYALYLLAMGRIPEARAEAERARQLDPTSFIVSNLIAIIFFESGEYDRAIEQLRKTLELNSSFDGTRVLLGLSYRQAGRFAEALAALDEATTGSSALSGVRAEVLAASGQRAAAQRLLADVEKRFSTEPLPRSILAAAHLALGEKDAALIWLERGVEERDQVLISLKISPQWDPIRADPRFQELLRRMNLE